MRFIAHFWSRTEKESISHPDPFRSRALDQTSDNRRPHSGPNSLPVFTHKGGMLRARNVASCSAFENGRLLGLLERTEAPGTWHPQHGERLPSGFYGFTRRGTLAFEVILDGRLAIPGIDVYISSC